MPQKIFKFFRYHSWVWDQETSSCIFIVSSLAVTSDFEMYLVICLSLLRATVEWKGVFFHDGCPLWDFSDVGCSRSVVLHRAHWIIHTPSLCRQWAAEQTRSKRGWGVRRRGLVGWGELLAELQPIWVTDFTPPCHYGCCHACELSTHIQTCIVHASPQVCANIKSSAEGEGRHFPLALVIKNSVTCMW